MNLTQWELAYLKEYLVRFSMVINDWSWQRSSGLNLRWYWPWMNQDIFEYSSRGEIECLTMISSLLLYLATTFKMFDFWWRMRSEASSVYSFRGFLIRDITFWKISVRIWIYTSCFTRLYFNSKIWISLVAPSHLRRMPEIRTYLIVPKSSRSSFKQIVWVLRKL